jgi:hypothetical protein
MFETAARLGIPLFIHPQIPQRAVRDVYYSGFGDSIDTAFATFALGWHYEAGIQFIRLMLAGVFAWIFLGEGISVAKLFGGVLIAAGATVLVYA